MSDLAAAGVRRSGGPSANEAPETAALVEGLRGSFTQACAGAGEVVTDHFRIAGVSLRLRFASRALHGRLTPALAHLRDPLPEARPALSVSLWDSESTSSAPPPSPPSPEGEPQGVLYHFHDPPLRGAYQPALGSLSVLDDGAGEAWHWVRSAFTIPYWDEACPIRQLLFWWLGAHGCLQVHGASVGTASGGVLVVGKGGSGKSTVALSSLGSELLYAGDDYVGVRVEPSPRIESLYSSGKLEPDHLHTLLPHLRPLLANGDRIDSEKAVIYVQQHFPEQLTAGFPLRAVLVPKVTAARRESRIVETSRGAAFAALAPSTMVQLHTADAGAFAMMSSLVRRLPCYGFELGSDVAAIPSAIASFLDRLPAA